MKKVLFLISFLSIFTLQAGDILTLTNQHTFEGKVIKIKDCTVVFKHQNERYEVPTNDIFSIVFESHKSKIYTKYMEGIINNDNMDVCLQGRMDASLGHGKKVGHFVLGVLFGPFAMLGTAFANPTPYNAGKLHLIQASKENFSDPTYLSCYKRKAKGELILWEGIGWLTIFILSTMA